MTNLMQVAAEIQQADWLQTLCTKKQISPYDWSIDEADEALSFESVTMIDHYWNQMYTGYWI